MSENYEVQPGECVSSIAYEKGFFWQTLWNHGENAALKQKRQNPNVLLEGDNLYIPDLRPKQIPCATGAQYKFILLGVPEKLRMTLKDANHKPRPNLPYTLVIDGKPHKGVTDGSGGLVESLPPDAKIAKLIIDAPPPPSGSSAGSGKSTSPPPKPRREIININLGFLDPVSELSGIKGRLMNFKLYRGPLDSNLDDNTRQALRTFQKRHGLPVTGEPDDATKALLQKLHGH